MARPNDRPANQKPTAALRKETLEHYLQDHDTLRLLLEILGPLFSPPMTGDEIADLMIAEVDNDPDGTGTRG